MKLIVWSFLLLALPLLAADDSGIIGGEDVTAEQHPWVVKIHYKGKGHCTGSLIGKQWIITAAHCLATAQAPYTDFTLGAGGDGKLSNLIRLPGIRQVFIHPNYRGPETTAQDLALIKLSQPIRQTTTIAPIPMKNTTGVRMHSGPLGSITAWGFTDSRGTLPNQLQSLTLPVIRAQELRGPPDYFTKHPEFMKPGILTMIKEGVTTCRGDSGAGWTMEFEGSPYLIGVHSAGDFCHSIAIGAEISQSLLWVRTRMLLSGL